MQQERKAVVSRAVVLFERTAPSRAADAGPLGLATLPTLFVVAASLAEGRAPRDCEQYAAYDKKACKSLELEDKTRRVEKPLGEDNRNKGNTTDKNRPDAQPPFRPFPTTRRDTLHQRPSIMLAIVVRNDTGRRLASVYRPLALKCI